MKSSTDAPKVAVGAGARPCAPPDPRPRKPRIELPPLACDCHVHICGPAERYPYSPKRVYTPPDALLADYERMLKALGISRAVLVQPSIYDADNRAMLDALRIAGRKFRAVAVIKRDIGERELEDLHAAGVRGVRVNVVDIREGKGTLDLGALKQLAERLRPFGWHVEFLLHVDEFPELDRMFSGFPVDIVFGHMGYMNIGSGMDALGFKALLRLMREGRAWVKLTAPYRISPLPLPYEDTISVARALVRAMPQRVIWGTDWPHVILKGIMPNDGDLCDLLCDWVPDAAQRKQILVDNPSRLYGLD